MSGLKGWCESSKSCPKYTCYCSWCFFNGCCKCFKSCCDHRSMKDIYDDFDKTSDQLSLFDVWSLGHILTGIVTSIPVFFIEWYYSYIITLTYALLWELFENSKIGVGMWRCLGYTKYDSDNFYNSMADIICNSIGFMFMFLIKALSS
jgi:hypothetical protein